MWTIGEITNVIHGGVEGHDTIILHAQGPGSVPYDRIQFSILLPCAETRTKTGDEITAVAKDRLIEACRQLVNSFG